jgi:BTB/POZ domain/helix-turn-helix, Psq domain
MSFVINTTIDKNKEFLDALSESYHRDLEKDVYLICKDEKIPINSFALALASDFFKLLLKDSIGKREIINIMVPDVRPEVLKKVVEYIYIGCISLETRFMGDFIEACNLLQLKATISCERKLVFDNPPVSIAPSATTTSNLATMIADFDDNIKYSVEDNNETQYELKQRTSDDNQILEVYEISNIEDAEMTYEDDGNDDETGEEHYELLSVIPSTDTTMEGPIHESTPIIKTEKKRKQNLILDSSATDIKPTIKMTPKVIDEAVMCQALNEVISNNTSFRIVSEKYSIPKTLLWRRAKKLGYVKAERQKDEFRLMAIEAIKQGESLISLSKRFNIPISTLHREKLKLYEKGLLPETVNLKNRSRGEDYDERLRCAIAEILNGKSQSEVAKKYNIPKTTIWRIIKKTDLKANLNREIVTPQSDFVQELLMLSKRRIVVKDEPMKEEPIVESIIEIENHNPFTSYSPVTSTSAAATITTSASTSILTTTETLKDDF